MPKMHFSKPVQAVRNRVFPVSQTIRGLWWMPLTEDPVCIPQDIWEKMAYLVKELEGVEDEKRTARFISVAAVVFPDGREYAVSGACEGKIGYEPKGENGFGFDPIFMVGDRSFAEFSAEEKDAVSHRGNSLRALKEKLEEIL